MVVVVAVVVSGGGDDVWVNWRGSHAGMMYNQDNVKLAVGGSVAYPTCCALVGNHK